MTLQRYDKDGLELVIDDRTGETFATIRGYARMVGKTKQSINKRVKGVNQATVKSAEIQTPGGLQGVTLIPESTISKKGVVLTDPLNGVPLVDTLVRHRLY